MCMIISHLLQVNAGSTSLPSSYGCPSMHFLLHLVRMVTEVDILHDQLKLSTTGRIECKSSHLIWHNLVVLLAIVSLLRHSK